MPFCYILQFPLPLLFLSFHLYCSDLLSTFHAGVHQPCILRGPEHEISVCPSSRNIEVQPKILSFFLFPLSIVYSLSVHHLLDKYLMIICLTILSADLWPFGHAQIYTSSIHYIEVVGYEQSFYTFLPNYKEKNFRLNITVGAENFSLLDSFSGVIVKLT